MSDLACFAFGDKWLVFFFFLGGVVSSFFLCDYCCNSEHFIVVGDIENKDLKILLKDLYHNI